MHMPAKFRVKLLKMLDNLKDTFSCVIFAITCVIVDTDISLITNINKLRNIRIIVVVNFSQNY